MDLGEGLAVKASGLGMRERKLLQPSPSEVHTVSRPLKSQNLDWDIREIDERLRILKDKRAVGWLTPACDAFEGQGVEVVEGVVIDERFH
jgi:hypothetical protein